MSRRLKIAVHDHRGKSRPFTGALPAAGHQFVLAVTSTSC